MQIENQEGQQGSELQVTAHMTGTEELGRNIRAALERETRINLHRYPIRVERVGGSWVLEGEVESVSAKKLALRLAGSTPAVTSIVDRLRVVPKSAMTDAEIRDHFRDALQRQPALEQCGIEPEVKGHWESVRQPATEDAGIVRAGVVDGRITLSGRVPSLTHQRLVGVLAWWVPGTRDVVNGLTVVPHQEDSNGDLADAVQLVLSNDPLVDASTTRVRCRNGIVILEGVVRDRYVAGIAVADAWYVLGVEEVVDRLVTA
ncbi:MAG TPA: BON domain-containing protein [Vicinamibacteria bacterium]